MSCDHCNPIGSADIPAGDTAECPDFLDPLSPCAGDAIHLVLAEVVVQEIRSMSGLNNNSKVDMQHKI